MLDAIVALVAGLLIVAGVIVILGPRAVARTLMLALRPLLRRPSRVPAVFDTMRPRDVAPQTLNPPTQRVVVAASRLANWLRLHGHEDHAREIRGAAARLSGNEPAGLYALQTAMRRVRVV